MADESKTGVRVSADRVVKWVPWDSRGHCRDQTIVNQVYVSDAGRHSSGATTVCRAWVPGNGDGWKPGFAWTSGAYVAHGAGKAHIAKRVEFLTVDPELGRVGFERWNGATPARHNAPPHTVTAGKNKDLPVARARFGSYDYGYKVGFANGSGAEIAHGDHKCVIKRDFDFLVVYPVATLELQDVKYDIAKERVQKDTIVGLHSTTVVNGDSLVVSVDEERTDSTSVRYSSSTTKALARAEVTEYSFGMSLSVPIPTGFGPPAKAGVSSAYKKGRHVTRTVSDTNATEQGKGHTTRRAYRFSVSKALNGANYRADVLIRELTVEIPFTATEVVTFADGHKKVTAGISGSVTNVLHSDTQVVFTKL